MMLVKGRGKRMRFVAVLNRDGGTLRTIDLDAFVGPHARDAGSCQAHSIDIDIVSGDELVDALDKAATGQRRYRLAGGGDGTVSAAAARLMDSKKALAILPAGTMNLFARSLGIPLTLDAAVQAFGEGERKVASTWPPPMAGPSCISSRSACTPRWFSCATRWNSPRGSERSGRLPGLPGTPSSTRRPSMSG